VYYNTTSNLITKKEEGQFTTNSLLFYKTIYTKIDNGYNPKTTNTLNLSN